MTGDYTGAARALEEALGISRDIGDGFGQANALNELGRVRRATGDCPGAARAQEEALGIYRDLGNWLGQANASSTSGSCGGQLGTIRARPGPTRRRWASTETSATGAVKSRLSTRSGLCTGSASYLRQAGSCHQRALDLARQIDSDWDEGHALAGLGWCAGRGHTDKGRRQAAAGVGDLTADRGGRDRRDFRRTQRSC